MTLAQIRYLLAVVDAGYNITAAATAVHGTQPGLSKQLKQLEEWFGFELFTRRGKALEGLSLPGLEVVEQARQIQAAAERLRTLRAAYARDQGGSLRIATTGTQARDVLPAAISRLRRRWPGLELHLQAMEDDAALRTLLGNGCDVAIVSSPTPPEECTALPLYRWTRHALLPHRHPLARREPLTLADLSPLPIVSYSSALRPGASLQAAFAAAGLPLTVGMSVGDGDLIRTYVRAGLGVGIVAPMALREDDDDLVARPLDCLPEMTTWFVLRPRQGLTRALEALLADLAPHVDTWTVRQAQLGDAGTKPLRGPVPAWQRPPTPVLSAA